MSKLELILLGQFECLLPSGKRISLPMRKAEVLLAYLALSPGLRHPRERLINLLWSDRGEEQARNSLRQCLSAIRKSLGEAADLALQVDRSTVSLQPGLIEVDVHEFERLADIGDYESLTTATDLYQGEFLEGIAIRDAACQEWLDNERSRFKRQFIEILLNLAETQLVSHDFGHAIKSAERLVKQDPLGESGWRLLMRSYFENGDRAHALQAFKRCQQALRDELEVDPETATIELRDQIAGGETKPASTPIPTTTNSTASPSSPTDHSIAVLPFDNLSGDPEQEYFSDGITDSIILNLSLFPGLQVKSRNSSFAFKQQIKSLGEISQELGVDYIVEGSIRKSADRIRITVQLIEAASGNQVWGKRYDAEIENLFDLEEDLSRSIAATVTGQIESELQRIAVAKGAEGQESYDLLLSGIYHAVRFNRQDSLIAIEKLNQCLAKDPDNVRAHVYLYSCHSMSYLERWTEDYRASFTKAAEHITRALAVNPESALVQAYYAEYLIFNDEAAKASAHLDKALQINPNDTDALTVKAFLLENIGEFEAALELIDRSLQLDPHHPWAEWELAVCNYYCGHYEAAIEAVDNARTSPSFTRIFSAAANLKLGRMESARQALRTFLAECRENMKSMPQSIDEWSTYLRENYVFKDPGLNESLIDCLRQTGLEAELTTQRSDQSETHSIAVLPFDNLSGDPAQEYFSDGITESIILNLSRFPGLNVKSRNSSFAFKQQIKSLGEISGELKVAYIVEGSIRKTDERIRVTVQLVEASSGNQVWGKRYDAEIENIFDLEEELSRSIAATVTGQIESDLRRIAIAKGAAHQQSYDLLLQGIYHSKKNTASDMVIAIEKLHQCLQLEPNNALAHANLYACHEMNWIDRWVSDFEASRKLCKVHARKALALNPELGQAHVAYAEYLIFNREFDEVDAHLNRALEINPNDSEAIAVQALNLSCQGEFEAALEKARLALQRDPYHTWVRWILSEAQFFCGLYEDVLATIAETGNPPGFIQIYKIAANIKLRRMEVANRTLKAFLQHCSESMSSMPRTINEWLAYSRDNAPFADPAINQEIIDYLLQAGLEEELAATQKNADPEALPSIAVLPFENMSGDPEQEHFSDGITADIIDTLSRFRHMRTVSRYSTLPYKTDKPTIAEIAAQQGVRYILEGSVRKSGDRIRVNAELIDSNNEQILWSERFDRDLDDLFAVQDELTQSITLAMKIQLDDGDMARLRSKGTQNIHAWELIMAAVDLQDTYIRKNILDARTMAEEAITLDPKYPYAWISLGWTHWQEAYSGWSQSIEVSNVEAEQANRRARDLDPDYAEVWSQMGMIRLMRHQAEDAIEDCLKAVELEPGSAEIQGLAAFACVFAGDYEQAQIFNQNMLRLSPVRANWNYLIEGQIEVARGNLEQATELYRQGLEVEPESPLCRFFLIDLMLQTGDEAAAKQYADEIRALDKSVSARGIAHTYSADPAIRDAFRARLAKYDLA